jgi:hypothetical protein
MQKVRRGDYGERGRRKRTPLRNEDTEPASYPGARQTDRARSRNRWTGAPRVRVSTRTIPRVLRGCLTLSGFRRASSGSPSLARASRRSIQARPPRRSNWHSQANSGSGGLNGLGRALNPAGAREQRRTNATTNNTDKHEAEGRKERRDAHHPRTTVVEIFQFSPSGVGRSP